MPRWTADILMYHSISDRGGPTSIPSEIFAAQMAALAASGLPVATMDDLADGALPQRSVILTFDDAFADFATTAWPVLEKHGFPSIVYVPTSRVGLSESWHGAPNPPRELMDWPTIRRLADEGVAFGNHSVSHPNLATLDQVALAEELAAAKATLEQELSRPVRHFAPPYGSSSPDVTRLIAQDHATSVGTKLGQADDRSSLFNLPRIEMYYFRSRKNWQRHLEGRGGAYLAARRCLRTVRNVVSNPGGAYQR